MEDNDRERPREREKVRRRQRDNRRKLQETGNNMQLHVFARQCILASKECIVKGTCSTLNIEEAASALLCDLW